MLSGYYLISDSSGKVLDDPGGSTSPNTQVDQWQLNGGANQQWNLVPVGYGNLYEVVNVQSHMALTAYAYLSDNGEAVEEEPVGSGGLNQYWTFQQNEPGALVNAQFGLVLGDPGDSDSNGTGLVQWQWTGDPDEQWTLVAAGDGPTVKSYIDNAATGLVLDDPRSSTSEGINVDQWQLNGTAAQQWLLVPLATFGNFLIVNQKSGLVLDDPQSSTSPAQIDLWQLNGTEAQQWEFTLFGLEPNGTPYGSGLIINVASGLLLDSVGTRINGYGVFQNSDNFSNNQTWWVFAAGNASPKTDYIQNNYDQLVLDDYVGNTDGGTMQQDYNYGNPSQQWTLVQLANLNYLIVNDASGMVLSDPTLSEGTPVVQNLLDGQAWQQWDLIQEGSNGYQITNVYSGLVVDDPAYDAAINTGLDMWVPLGGSNQWWNIIAGPSGVDIHGQPSNAVVGQPISPAITVAVVDAKGNTVTTNNTQLVTLAIASGPAGAKLLGTTTVRAVNGVADFTNLTLSLAGTYTLTATGGALTPDFSNVFTIAPVNVTSAVTIRRGSMHKVGRTSHSGSGGELLAQTITIKNASRQPLGGPLALRVGSLPTGVTLANATGTYEGGPYRDVLAALQPLAPGKSVTVTLDFSMSGRRSPSLSKLDEDLEALLGI